MNRPIQNAVLPLILLAALAVFAFEAWRMYRRRARIAVDSLRQSILFLIAQLLAGTLAIAVLLAQHALLADTVANTTLDLLHFSLHPWNTALTALQVAIVIWDATAIALLVLIFRAAYLPWRIARMRWRVQLAAVICWLLPTLIFLSPQPVYGPLILALILAASVALGAGLVGAVMGGRR